MAARQVYQKLDPREHVLARPGMYVGSVEPDTYSTWVFDGERMVRRDVRFAPGLYKIFDEILVNALDQVKRLRKQKAEGHDVVPVRSIKVDVDREAGTVQVVNDGDGVDVDVDAKTGLLIPEMVFGHLLTSANYAETDKTVGGQNGIGAKATNIFSTEFHVETIDHRRGKVYRQTWKDNMSRAGKADVRSSAKKAHTLVRFRPDFARFGETGISDDLFQLIHKRVYDAAAVSGADVSVAFNGQKLEVKTFEKYVDMYVGAKDEHARVYEAINDSWEVVVTHSDSGMFDQVSFVNGIWTLRGGKHVEHIANQVVAKLGDLISKKNKGSSVKSSHIRNNLFVFINCTIPDPAFDGQSKEQLTTPASKFGAGKLEVSDKLIEKIYKSSGLMDRVLELVEASDASLAKKTDGKKKASVRGLVKLDDANFAGTAKSASCTLMLTEGDSARSTAIAGLAVVGRDTYGVFPLRGKVLNTLDISAKKVAENEEITNLKKILGLESGRKYTSVNELRYGRIMVCADQDPDGAHVTGLLFNLFSSLWPSLIQQEGFLCRLSTPLIKVTGGKYTQPVVFYNLQDYEQWKAKQRPADLRAAKIKYNKGLGSLDTASAREYFTDLKKITFEWTGDGSKEALDLAFNKKRADDRKAWLAQYDREATLDYNMPRATFEEFVHKDLIHFSSYDVERSIPNVMDGLKTSQRKVLHACFKRDIKDEMKVAQLAGYTAEATAYIHGEAALNGTIIGLAQDFVGSNNANLLQPKGQFGCLAPETPVLLWDGSRRAAKDIVVGDKLVGDDGQPRNVLATTAGEDEMYEIKMAYGSYVVNSQHILTLTCTGVKEPYWLVSSKAWKMYYFDTRELRMRSKTFRTGPNLSKEAAFEAIAEFAAHLDHPRVFDIKVDAYLKLPKSTRDVLSGVKSTAPIQWPTQPVPIDPYILGCWLGDGDSNGDGMAGSDKEILQAFALYAETINCELVHNVSRPTKTGEIKLSLHYTIREKGAGKRTAIGDTTHSSTTCLGCQTAGVPHDICDFKFDKAPTRGGTRFNSWLRLLKASELFMNKRIPVEYIMNDVETRLQLLAGFIDTDGGVRYRREVPHVYISQSKRLRAHVIEALEFIAQSLGFRTSIHTVNTGCITPKGRCNEGLCLIISGPNIHLIPTRVPRKQMAPFEIKHQRTFPFEVIPKGKGAFCGWQVDGNERFLLGDFTVTHNSRIQGGKDAAAPRYIHTCLSPVTRKIFIKEDEQVLEYLEDDGQVVEPRTFCPIIPMVLVNGATGIATAFSTSIPSHDPRELIAVLRLILEHGARDQPDPSPWYRGHKGAVEADASGKLTSVGVFARTGPARIRVTELPIMMWTEDFKQLLEDALEAKAGLIKNYKSNYDNEKVDFEIEFASAQALEDLMASSNASTGYSKLHQELKLTSTRPLQKSNMYLFDAQGRIKKYASTMEIIHDFCEVRLGLYDKRKQAVVASLKHSIKFLEAKARFINEVITKKVTLSDVKRADVEAQLRKGEYPTSAQDGDDGGGYEYLLRLPMSSLTHERKLQLEAEAAKARAELAKLQKTSPKDMWLAELAALEAEL